MAEAAHSPNSGPHYLYNDRALLSDSRPCFARALVAPQIHLFIFDRPPHSFDVVQVPSLAVHAGLDTLLRQDMTSDSFVEVVQDVVDLTGTTKVSLDDRTKAPVSLPNCCSPIMGLDTSPERPGITYVGWAPLAWALP